VEKKIVKAAVAIAQGKQKCLYLGNIYSYRDFGHAKDFVKAMWLMLQQEKPDDYVIASGEKHLIKDIVDKVFKMVGLEIVWYGSGDQEYACIDDNIVISIDSKYYRPSEVDSLHGDSTNARNKLGWEPTYNMESILKEMISDAT
jgi:GDPmannose 4,6-dehydratase